MKRKIICLGDSLTYGYPYGPQFSWVYYVGQKITGLNLVNAGVNGDTLEDMARRFGRDVITGKPSALVILGGTNDAFCRDISLAATLNYLDEMLKNALDKGIEPIIGLPVPVVDDLAAQTKLERLSLSYRERAMFFNLWLLDFATPFFDPVAKTPRQELYLDGVHPNQKGYKVMGETALTFFNNYYLKRKNSENTT